MNPVAAQGLDPKLKEAYDRVMGAEIAPQPSSPVSTQPAATVHEPIVAPSAPPQTQSQTPAEAVPAAEPQQHVFIATSPSGSTQTAVVKKPGKKISPIIFIAAGVVFFLGYTAVWLKVFGII